MNPDVNDPEWVSEQQAKMKRQTAIVDRLIAENPGLPAITAIVMAGDLESAERVDKAFRAGEMDVDRALMLCGSYARFEYAYKWWIDGLLASEALFEQLPELWRGSDPDDTDPRYYNLWWKAWAHNGGAVIVDDKHLPEDDMFDVYRGQPEGAPLGIAWSLSEETAGKFAMGAWARTAVTGGVILKAKVKREFILAYLTGRGEEEIIVHPTYLVTKA